MNSETNSARKILEDTFGPVGSYWDEAIEDPNGSATLIKRDAVGNEIKILIEGNELTIIFGYWHTHYSLRESFGSSDLPDVKSRVNSITTGSAVLVARKNGEDWVGSGTIVDESQVDVKERHVSVPDTQFGAYASRKFNSYVVWKWGVCCGLTTGASGEKAAKD